MFWKMLYIILLLSLLGVMALIQWEVRKHNHEHQTPVGMQTSKQQCLSKMELFKCVYCHDNIRRGIWLRVEQL